MQVILSGLAIGAIYGFVGMGFSVVFYVTRVINFAQGQLLMVAVMLAATLATAGVPPLIGAIVGVLAAAVFGVLLYVVAVRPVLQHDRFSFAWLVSTLGAATVLESVAALIWGPTSRAFPTLLNGSSIHIAGATITVQQALAVVLAVVIAVVIELVRRRTLLGKVGIAIAQDPEMASSVGANTTAFAFGAFALAGALAGIAGILIGPLTYSNPYLGDTYGIAGFVALMIGGTSRPFAAMGGGLLLGILSQLAQTVINSQASDWLPYLVVAVILLLVPQGLFSFSLQPLVRYFRRDAEREAVSQ